MMQKRLIKQEKQQKKSYLMNRSLSKPRQFSLKVVKDQIEFSATTPSRPTNRSIITKESKIKETHNNQY